jgi:8-oxo-dGTP diphosphatase
VLEGDDHVLDRKTGWWFTPASVKVLVVAEARVLLCQNAGGDWELPGGWPDRADTDLVGVAAREVREETGLQIAGAELVGADLFSDEDHGPVVLVFLRAATASGREPAVSDEHVRAAFFARDDLPDPLPDVYRAAIARL